MHLSTTRSPARHSRRSPVGLVLASVMLAACAVTASSLSALEAEKKPAAKKGPVSANIPGAKSASAPARGGAVVADLLQRRRAGIAKMFEGHYWLRGMSDGGAAKFAEAKLAGPFEFTNRSIFSQQPTTRTLYCVEGKLALMLSPTRTALIEIDHPKEGGERMIMRMNGYTPFECNKADYKPFPEVEQLRRQRRQALGHPD